MYYRKFIEFLKKHGIYDKEIVDYFMANSTKFDYRIEEDRTFIGVYYVIKNNILDKIKVVVPYLNDDKTVLINIHEYVHLYKYYNKLGKLCHIGKDKEVLPIFYEKLFVKENPTKELIDYHNNLNESINNSKDEEYLLALRLSTELMNSYDNENINKLNVKVKKLMFKDIINNILTK